MSQSQLIDISNLFFNIIRWMILARIIMSWIPHKRNNPITQMLFEATEPILAPFRRLMPTAGGMPIDFSPFIAIIVLSFINSGVNTLIRMYL